MVSAYALCASVSTDATSVAPADESVVGIDDDPHTVPEKMSCRSTSNEAVWNADGICASGLKS